MDWIGKVFTHMVGARLVPDARQGGGGDFLQIDGLGFVVLGLWVLKVVAILVAVVSYVLWHSFFFCHS